MIRVFGPLGTLASLVAVILSTSNCRPNERFSEVAEANDFGRGVTELSSSIITVGDSDILSDRCVQMVDRATRFRQKKLMFVPTLFWMQTGDGPVDYYCYNRTFDNNGQVQCPAATSDTIERFRWAMQRCFQRAIDSNMSIALTPHLDDGSGGGRWRNLLAFDPLEKRNGYSYADVVLYPLADALRAVGRSDTKIYFGMQGEMSSTVFRHPQSWRRLIPDLRQRLALGNAKPWNIQIGVNTNFNKICGCVGSEIIDPSEFVLKYPALWDQKKNEFDVTGIKDLYYELDYFGISSYPSLKPGFSTYDVQNAIYQFDFELKLVHPELSVQKLLSSGKKLHLSEYGIGGGANQNGTVLARNAEEAAKYPFFGIFGVYRKATDPWRLYDTWTPYEPRDYMHYFYDKTLEFLRNESQFDYTVDAAFLWNQGSWDIQAIYPESTSYEGSFADPYVIQKINEHNSRA